MSLQLLEVMGASPLTYEEDQHFQLRVCAVVVNDGKVLIHRSERDDFWALPGGHVEIMESSKEALKREMKEEFFFEFI